ncbi:MAG: hypothetical protein LBD46_08450 [Endomicrobium sp.]|jgi:hypothetical protein|nr:hypothetical protein [Endomicrobium sp.]
MPIFGAKGIKKISGYGGGSGGGVTKEYLEKNYLTMQEVYNSFASTYWEVVGTPSGESKNIVDLAVGDDLNNAVVDVSNYVVGIEVQASQPSAIFSRTLKGTPNLNGDYLTLEFYTSDTVGGKHITIKLNHIDANDNIINTAVLLVAKAYNYSNYHWLVDTILQKKSAQILQLDNIDFGIITEIINGQQGNTSYFFNHAKCFFYGSTPLSLVNLPYLYSKIGYAASAEIELGEAGDYTSEPLWLRDGFVVRELKAVITDGTEIKGVASDKISFNPAAKTITISIDEDLTGWTAKAQVVYDIEEQS